MSAEKSVQPYILLIDDDDHSAYLLTRMLSAHGAPEIRHFASAVMGEDYLTAILPHRDIAWPGLVIADLKAHSRANHEFAARNQARLRQRNIPLAVMTPPTDWAGRKALHDAGATAIFVRQAELDAYRHEAAAIVSFWARHRCLDAVGM